MNEVEKAIEAIETSLINSHKIEGWKFHEVRHEPLMIALNALRSQQERDENKPLTLKELREMDGEPVYLTFPHNERHPFWAIINKDVNDKCMIYSSSRGAWAYLWFEDYGETWLAYRRKLEAEE